MTPGEKAFLICLALFMAWIVWEIVTAPEGHQDSNGWHAGAGVDEWEDGV
jgi:hypothetical protein